MKWKAKHKKRISKTLKCINSIKSDGYSDYIVYLTADEDKLEAEVYVTYAQIRNYVDLYGLNIIHIQNQDGSYRHHKTEAFMYINENLNQLMYDYINQHIDFKILNLWT